MSEIERQKLYTYKPKEVGELIALINYTVADVTLVNDIYSIIFFLLEVHVAMASEVADHGQSFALSDPDKSLSQKMLMLRFAVSAIS